MKIVVSATGETMESKVDPRFGRAAFFIYMDTDTMEFESIENTAASASGGAGIKAAQSVIDRGAGAVITGHVGPNAMEVLKQAGIEVYAAGDVSVGEAVELFKKGLLSKITSPGSRHFGMGTGGAV